MTIVAVMAGLLVVVAIARAAVGSQLTPAEGLAFTDEVGGSGSATQQATLTNTGDEDLTTIVVSVSGAAPDRFQATDDCGDSLTPGQHCTIDVSFSAATPGAVAASLDVASNGPPQSIALSGTGTPAPAPVAGVAPTALDFATTAGTTSAAQVVTLSNTGNAPLDIDSITITGPDADVFDSTDDCGASLPPGAQCTVSVTYNPTTAGSSTATLTFTDNDQGNGGSTQSVDLTGSAGAAAVPVAGVAPGGLSFTATEDTTSAPQNVALSNSGNAPLQISSISIVGADASRFSRTHDCGSSLAPGTQCTVAVTFSPTTTGAHSATLQFTDDHQGASGSTQTVSLTGTATAAPAPVAGVTPTSLTFTTTAGTTSATQNATLSNTGNAPLSIAGVSLVGSDPARFALASNTCGSSLAAGASCTVGVTFSPTSTGARSATLRFTDNHQGNAGSTQNVSLSGTGTAAPAAVATVAPTSLSFSTPTGTTSGAQSVTLKNTGDATLSISSVALTGAGAARFAIANGCGATLAPGAQCIVDVSFRPVANGSQSANLVFTDNNQGPGGTTQTVALSGTGIPAPVAGVAPATLMFTTAVGTVSAPQRVTLSNSGTANLTSVGMSIVGAHFTIIGSNCTSVLAPGASCTVDVTFSPPFPGGPFTATLRFSGNDPVQSTQDVALSGTATSATPPPVDVIPPPVTPPPVVPPPVVAPPPDADGDGVPDSSDLCRATPGNLANGCPSELNAEIRGVWRVNNLLSQLMTLTVRAATGSRITMRCSNARGSCGFNVRTIAKTTQRQTSLTRYFKGRRILPAGAIITVRVTRSLQIGSYKRLTTRRGRKLPRVLTRCLDAGTSVTRACP